jgi:hypothetical protein
MNDKLDPREKMADIDRGVTTGFVDGVDTEALAAVRYISAYKAIKDMFWDMLDKKRRDALEIGFIEHSEAVSRKDDKHLAKALQAAGEIA